MRLALIAQATLGRAFHEFVAWTEVVSFGGSLASRAMAVLSRLSYRMPFHRHAAPLI